MGRGTNQIATIGDVNQAFGASISGTSSKCVTKSLLENSGMAFTIGGNYSTYQLVKFSDISKMSGNIYWAFGNNFGSYANNVEPAGWIELTDEDGNTIVYNDIQAPFNKNGEYANTFTSMHCAFPSLDLDKNYTLSLSLEATILAYEGQAVPSHIGIYIFDDHVDYQGEPALVLVQKVQYDYLEEPDDDSGSDGAVSYSASVSFNVNDLISSLVYEGTYNANIIIALLDGESDYVLGGSTLGEIRK
jgi:hypothetical protein